MSSRSKGVTNVASSRWPISWLISSPRCSVARISAARASGGSYVRSIASSWRAPTRTFAASSTNRSKKRSSRGISRRRTRGPPSARPEEGGSGREGSSSAARQALGSGGRPAADRVPRPSGRCAMLGAVDWILVAFVGLMAIALAVAVGYGLDRERALDAARDAAVRGGASDDPGADLPTLIRRLRDRLDASEFELDQQVRNASY